MRLEAERGLRWRVGPWHFNCYRMPWVFNYRWDHFTLANGHAFHCLNVVLLVWR